MKSKALAWIAIVSVTVSLYSHPVISLAAPAGSVKDKENTILTENITKNADTESIETQNTSGSDLSGDPSGSNKTEGDWEYSLKDSEATICHYNGTDTEITIPGTLGGYPVTALGPSVFTGEFHPSSSLGTPYYDNDTTITSVTIPASITEIDMRLFEYMEVLEIIQTAEDNSAYSSQDGVLFSKHKDVVHIYPRGKKDTAYTVPDSVIETAQDCFSHNSFLQTLDLNHTQTMHYRIINGCHSLKTLDLGDSCIDINTSVVTSCNALEEITVPNTVMRAAEIYNDTPALSKLTIPDGGQYYISEDNIIFNKERTILAAYASARAEADYTIPDTVTTIAAAAFRGVQNLKKVTVSEAVSHIAYEAFDSPILEEVTVLNTDCEITEYPEAVKTFHKNTLLCGDKPSAIYDYASEYGRTFRNIEDGSTESNEITYESLVKLLPKDTSALGEPTYAMSDVIHESDTSRAEYIELKEFTDSLTAGCTTILEKINAVSNWVYKHISYSFGSFGGNTIDSVYYLYKTEAPTGNCMAYTRLASYMLYLAGIPTVNVQNKGHEWCMAYIEDSWWIIDATNNIVTDDYSNELHMAPKFLSFSENGNIYAVRNHNGVYLTGFNYSHKDASDAKEVIIPDYVDRIDSSAFDAFSSDDGSSKLTVTCSSASFNSKPGLKRDLKKIFSCIREEEGRLTARLHHDFPEEWNYVGNTSAMERHCRQCGAQETKQGTLRTPVWNGQTSHTDAVGKSFSLKTTCSSDAKITYVSSAPKIVSVSSSGTVTLKSAGTAKITLSVKATSHYAASQRIVTIKAIDIQAPQITGFKTSSAGSSSVRVTVTWKKVKNADSYRLYCGYVNNSNHTYKSYKENGKAVKTASITLSTRSDSSNKIWIEAYNSKNNVTSTASSCRYYTRASVTLSTKAYAYNGKAKTPAVTVKTGKKILKKNTDYTVSYSNNKKIGTAKAVISFKGNYRGTRSVSFTIKPPKTTLSSARYSSGGNITIRWKRNPYAGGCQIQYAANKSFTKNKKTVNVSKAKTISKKVPALKKKRPCYVRIRAYKVVSGKKYYSDWSTAKTVK